MNPTIRSLVVPTLFGLLLFGNSCKKSADDILSTASQTPLKVEKLDLGLQRLGTLPPVLFTFPNLKWLDIRLNRLETLSENLCDLERLEYLNIYGNDLKRLPASFAKLEKLRVLFAGNNDFERIPPELKGLPLEAIYIDQNKLTLNEQDIDILGNLQRLEILDLSKNRAIVSFPKNLDSLANHPKLRVLILKDSGLRTADVNAARKLLPKIRIEF
ncbi:leucine rich repeat protein [Leptospira fainei serovar Hurstbridge str. BUT 6]|uniref:Leucine rich repeat protein n=1 Tax=Leptospira fainei serovar Hurstbridge str. BUT 6 TaxID=1193011 RepID=S3W887_9LEPT|nr:leucine-rich repeat domain-containing protein [Leptospira fainei]EPG76272.1 leucine rich repeat protein [Leptospira fainei serovar Hurstbridge str. BUT 6]